MQAETRFKITLVDIQYTLLKDILYSSFFLNLFKGFETENIWKKENLEKCLK